MPTVNNITRFARLYLGVHLPSVEERATNRRNENVGSICLVPRSVLPHGPAREQLIALASEGKDVYCYMSGSPLHGTWCVWLETERLSLAAYQAEFLPTAPTAQEAE